jgi:hypothetical protein
MDGCVEEAWEARTFSKIAPRDFDISPYFAVVKPLSAVEFDYTQTPVGRLNKATTYSTRRSPNSRLIIPLNIEADSRIITRD